MQTLNVYIKDKEIKGFLADFFKKYRSYQPVYFTNVRQLMKHLKATNTATLITESPSCLDNIEISLSGYPTVALLTQDITNGIKSIVQKNIEHYVLPPYRIDDFRYKLRISSTNLHNVQTLYQEKRDIEAISELTHVISSSLDPQKVLYMIVRKLSELLPVTRCSIISTNSEDVNHAHVISTFENPFIRNLKLDMVKYPEIEKAVKTKKSVIINDAQKDPLMTGVGDSLKPLDIRSIVVIPIMFRSEVIGTLFLRTSSRRHKFTKREINLCQAIAAASSQALYHAYLFQEVNSQREHMEQLAITDFMTGIYNVRYLYHRLESEYSRAVRYNQPMTCIMFDIDHFKKINDTYGHRTGDLVLKEFASILMSLTRKSDVFARYGGEEFIMLLPQTTLAGGQIKAERIANVIRNHRFKTIEAECRITVSIGISCLPDQRAKSYDDLIAFADDALLQAKSSGRDKVITNGQ